MNADFLFQNQSNNFAGDGFLNNLSAVLVRLTGPLVTNPAKPPLDKIWPRYVLDKKRDDSLVLPGKFWSNLFLCISYFSFVLVFVI